MSVPVCIVLPMFVCFSAIYPNLHSAAYLVILILQGAAEKIQMQKLRCFHDSLVFLYKIISGYSVYSGLYYNARVCFSSIQNRISRML